MSSSFKQCPTHFSRGGRKILQGGFAPLVTDVERIVMALGHYMCHQFGKSTKSKGSSPAESTYQTDARWRRTAMWREGL